MGFGTISSMISSLKSNKSLRRNKESYSRFSKKSEFNVSKFNPLSKEENFAIVNENKQKLKRNTRTKYIYGIFMTLLYLSILAYALIIFL